MRQPEREVSHNTLTAQRDAPPSAQTTPVAQAADTISEQPDVDDVARRSPDQTTTHQAPCIVSHTGAGGRVHPLTQCSPTRPAASPVARRARAPPRPRPK